MQVAATNNDRSWWKFLLFGGKTNGAVGCGPKTEIEVTGKDTGQTPNTISTETEAFYVATPGDSLTEEINFSHSYITSVTLTDVSGEIGLDPDYVNPRNKDEVPNFPPSGNYAVPLWLQPDAAFASPEVASGVTIPEAEETYSIIPKFERVSLDSFLVNWIGIDNANSYIIYIDGAEKETIEVTDPYQGKYELTVSDLSNNTEYSLQIVALDEEGSELAYSEVVPIETHWASDESELLYPFSTDASTIPAEPQITSVDVGSTYIQTTWQPVEGASIYEVSLYDEEELLSTETTTGYNMTMTSRSIPGGLVPGSNYTISVIAYAGQVLNTDAYGYTDEDGVYHATIDLSNTAYLAYLDDFELSYVNGSGENTPIQCENPAEGCVIDIDGDVPESITFYGSLTLHFPSNTGTESQFNFDAYSNGTYGFGSYTKITAEYH